MARRIFNPTGGQIALAAGAAILGGLAYVDYKQSKKKAKKKPAPLPPPDDSEKDIADQLIVLISPTPAPRSLYQIESGNNFAGIVRDVFDAAGIPEAKNDQDARVAYMKCVSSSAFNRTLYGKADDFTDGPGGLKPGDKNYPGNFPKYTSPDNISLRSAFLNRSTDYVQQLADGHVPIKTGGGRLGLLWLPGIDTAMWTQVGKITCVDIEPPPIANLIQG